MVIPLSQRVDSVDLLLWGVPDYLVHSWGVFALVFCHSSDGESFAAERVSQQTLEGFHLVPFAFLSRLDDSSLQPTHIAMNFLPVDGVPVRYAVEGRTSSVYFRDFCRRGFCRHLLFLLVSFIQVFSSRKTSRKFARFRVRCCCNLYPSHYRRAFAFSAFLYPLSHRRTLRLPTANGRDRAYRVSQR